MLCKVCVAEYMRGYRQRNKRRLMQSYLDVVEHAREQIMEHLVEIGEGRMSGLMAAAMVREVRISLTGVVGEEPVSMPERPDTILEKGNQSSRAQSV